MAQSLKTTDIVAAGLMTFALFLGAGNIIFPPFLGFLAGDQLFIAMLGFLLTGVGLPLLGLVACARVGGGMDKLTEIFSPKLALTFAVVLFLAIGPLFASPRTATVSYELSILPFIGEASALSLAIFSAVFFAVTLYFSLVPGKLVENVGKMITPLLVIVLAIIAVGAYWFPQGVMGTASESMTGKSFFFKGFIDGYQTMDTLGALVFGIVVIQAIQGKGITDNAQVARYTMLAGLIAAVGLAMVYVVLGYIGATSQNLVANPSSGAPIIAAFVDAVFGSWGKVVLAITVILACLTTAIGLMTACGAYFSRVFPVMNYRQWVILFTVMSAIISNAGLATLLSVTIPALVAIYPVAIALITVSLLKPYLSAPRWVMNFVLVPVGLIAIVDGLGAAGIKFAAVNSALSMLPLHAEGLVWLVPGIIAGVIGVATSPKTVEVASAA